MEDSLAVVMEVAVSPGNRSKVESMEVSSDDGLAMV